MKYLSLTVLCSTLVLASGCAQVGHYNTKMQNWLMGEHTDTVKADAKGRAYRSSSVDMTELMSNESVIVYPVSNDQTTQRRQSFDGPRESYPRGGHKVFDSSVEVFSVDGPQAMPGYVPEYAVPLYGQGEYSSLRPVSPSQSYSKLEPNTKPTNIKRGPLMPMEEGPKSNPGRRSSPVLTSY